MSTIPPPSPSTTSRTRRGCGAQTSKRSPPARLLRQRLEQRDRSGRRAAPRPRCCRRWRPLLSVSRSRHRPAGSARVVSPHPPRAASPCGSRVTTVTAPPRSKARTWSAATPDAGTAAYDVKSSGRSRRSRSASRTSRSLGWPGRSSATIRARASKSTGRRLSGSTRLSSRSSEPW